MLLIFLINIVRSFNDERIGSNRNFVRPTQEDGSDFVLFQGM